MANSFHFDGTDCSAASYGLTVLNDSAFPIYAETKNDYRQAVHAYGGSSSGNGYGPRKFAVRALISGSSTSDLESKLDALNTLLNPFGGAEKSLRFDDFWSTRYWMARYDGGVVAPLLTSMDVLVDLPFTASDSRGYSTTARSSPDFTLSASPQTLTVESGPTAVAGNAPCDPVWLIKNTSGGTITTLTVNNTTTVESLTWTGSLANNSWLRITTGLAEICEVSTDSGAIYTASMSGVSGTFPTLKGGATNSVTVTGLSTGTVVLTYTARFL